MMAMMAMMVMLGCREHVDRSNVPSYAMQPRFDASKQKLLLTIRTPNETEA
jgi:hypothetical protein